MAMAAKKQQSQQSEQSKRSRGKFSRLSSLFQRKTKDEFNRVVEDDFNGNTNTNSKNSDQESLPAVKVPKRVVPIAYKFLASLWRGITLPFPTLRNADNSPTFSLQECVIAIVAYLSLGAIAYTSVFEKWSLVDALYFSVVSFSTVGYGDMCPSNLPSKLFTCIFGLGGVAFLGIAIATIGSALVEAELEAAKKLGAQRFMKIFDNMPPPLAFHVGGNGSAKTETTSTSDSKQETTTSTSVSFWPTSSSWKGLIPKFFPSLSLLFIGGGIIGQFEGWSWFDSIYYSFITAGTLGYGDFSPKTQIGRALALVFLPIAVASAGEILGAVSKVLVTRRQHIRNEQLLHRALDLEFLKEMDADGDGKVSRYEYITFMLQAMGAVDLDLLAELNIQFDTLDASKDGSLGVEDLKIMAEASGMNVKSKVGGGSRV